MASFDTSVIINAHREGLLANGTLRSVKKAVYKARSAGINVEIICVLDNSDEATSEIFARFSQSDLNVDISHVNFGDLGLARNYGVLKSGGNWVAFLDADDLWCDNWLACAYRNACAEERSVIWHSHLNIYFGGRSHIFVHVDMDETYVNPAILACNNLWTALCFSKRDTLLNIPYKPTYIDRQIGYEDWSWYIDTVASGYVHKVVHGTVHAIRVKKLSLVSSTAAANCFPYVGKLFSNILDSRNN